MKDKNYRNDVSNVEQSSTYMKPIITFKQSSPDFPKTIRELSTMILRFERQQKLKKIYEKD